MKKDPALPFILVTVFLDMLGIGIVIPVLPALVGTLAPNRDMQSYWYGALLASYGLAQFCFAPLLGAMSDQWGRRPVLLVSIFGLGVNFLLTALSPWLWLLLVSRLIGGATGASYSVASAYIADVTPPEERSKSFGVLGAVIGLGFICGPMVGGLLAAHSLRLPYYVAASLALLNWLNGFFVLPESLPRDRRSRFSLAKANPFVALAALAKVRGVGGLIVVYTLTVLPQFILQTTWVLYMTFRFGWGPFENGISLFVFGATTALAQGGLLGLLLRRFGDVRTALLGLTSSVIAYVLYGLAEQGWMIYAIIAGNLLGSVTSPALQGIVSKAVDPRAQGITMGSLNSISSIMGVIAPLIGTPLLAFVAHFPQPDFRIGATFFLAAAVQTIALVQAHRHFRKVGTSDARAAAIVNSK